MKYLKTIYVLLSWTILKRDTLASRDPIFLVTEQECITANQSAIAFITHVDDVIHNAESKFLPPIDDHYKDIDCKIEHNEECTRNWTSEHWSIKNSTDGPVNKIITDWRWEALHIFKTVQINAKDEELNYEYILSVHKENFDIPISVRTEQEAHVFLCENKTNPHNSNCYWIMLQGFNGTKTALRKCSSGYINDVYNRKPPRQPCSDILTENKDNILSEKFWSHFRIIKRNNTIILRSDRQLLRFTDDNPFHVRHMFFHSKRVNGLWKAHTYSYIYCRTKLTEAKGPKLVMMKGENCISMFVVMCANCQMIVILRGDKGSTINIPPIMTEDENWREVKIVINSSTEEKFQIYISTDSSKDSGIFWAIDHVRRCIKTEYRILKLPGSRRVPCQTVENKNTLDIDKLKDQQINELDSNCSESTFGKQCIPCQDTLCKNFKYCEYFNKDIQCYCSPGYLADSITKSCNKKCNHGRYGHGCIQYCGNCDGDCDNVDGHCINGQCINGFQGEKCDIPSASFSKYSINILNSSPTSCTFEILNTDNYNNYFHFKIRYKKTDSNLWVYDNNLHPFLSYNEINITNLEPDAQYHIQAVFYSYQAYEGITNTQICQTTCNGIQFRDISFDVGSTSVEVHLQLSTDTCPISNYKYSIGSSSQIVPSRNFNITGLTPNTEYCLKLSHVFRHRLDVSNCFSTTRGVPETPYNVTGNWTWNNDLQISWKYPNITNEFMKNFTIELSSGAKNINNYNISIKSEDVYNSTYTYQITNTYIEPCSEYTVTVRAHNKYQSSFSARFTDWSPPPIPLYLSDGEFKTTSTSHTITIEIPPPQYKTTNEINFQEKVYLLIAESVETEEICNEKLFENFLRNKLKDARLMDCRILLETGQDMLPMTFKIGNDSVTQNGQTNLSNPPLDLGKAYKVNLFFTNECHGKIRFKRINKTVSTSANPSTIVEDEPYTEDSYSGLYALTLLILVIPLLAYVYMYIKKEKNRNSDILAIFKQPRSSTAEEPPNKRCDEIPLVNEASVRVTLKPVVKSSIFGSIPPVIKTAHSKSIKINDFETYVKKSLKNGELARQHELFLLGQTKPWDYGALIMNKSKNRYNNIIAYDHTRVKLNKIPGVENSDYINASYIDGYRAARAYIATQGPKASTLNDFWRMIWKENVKHIVMLANVYESGKKKVEKYWPDINEEKDFNGIKVQHVSREVFADYEFKVFKVYNNNQQRKVKQLHFTSWPDHGVPLYSQSLMPFLQKILKIPYESGSPIVVHCSAGVGRTGTIILCDICLRMALGEGSVDFLANLENLRNQRANMVDNIEQYKLAHLVVLDCLVGMHTSIACNENMTNAIKELLSRDGIKAQLKYLVDTEWKDKAMETVWDDEETPIYPEKNRFQDIVPDPQYRVCLVRYPRQDEHSSYINAIQVDGFRSPGRFIVTQQPMPNTLGDFWRLVVEKKSTVIVSLNEINTRDQKSCQFWPEEDSEIKPVDYLKISHVNSRLLNCYRTITVRVTNQKEKKTALIKIISIINWKPTDLLPNSVEEYLSFWEESDALARQSNPVVVTCYNGATASGLYLATSFLIEKMKLEQECDVCLAVRTIRHSRKQFVNSEEQFEFLYRASLTYINSFQSYANFT